MVQATKIFTAIIVAVSALVLNVAAADSDQHHVSSPAELVQTKPLAVNERRSLAACADSPHVRTLQQRALERRTNQITNIRDEIAARRRLDTATVLATNHKTNKTSITKDSPSSELFDEVLDGCILAPEVPSGPYYVRGQRMRKDIRETQAGVDLYTVIQLIDVNTCKPMSDTLIDIWHSNSTGVYSGVVAASNGNSNDVSNINTTFNRGLAMTDEYGTATFLTTFPGHHTGRATHIHVIVTRNAIILQNGTSEGGTVQHVGEIYFDQSLIAEVEATDVYTTNKQPLTTNERDSIFAQSTAADYDPVVEYAYLGDSVEDGIFSWISIGFDVASSFLVCTAARFTANGGVAYDTTDCVDGRFTPPTGGGVDLNLDVSNAFDATAQLSKTLVNTIIGGGGLRGIL